jgi:hypothetical protein
MRKPVLRVLLPMFLVVACAVVDAQQGAPPKQPAGPQETPSQFYSRYRSAVQSAKSLDEVTKFWQKSLAAEFNQAPPDQRVDLAALKRLYGKVSDVNVVSVSIGTGGSSATMKLTGKTADGKKMSGTAAFVQEDGSWKLAAQEDWQEQSSK